MATVETVERAIFVAENDRRARRLRRAGVAVVTVSGLWVAALGIGMLGLGRLPGVSLPIPGGAEPQSAGERSLEIVRTASPIVRVPPRGVEAGRRVASPRTQGSAASRSRARRSEPATQVVTVKPPRSTSPPSVAPVATAPAPQTTSRAVRRGLIRRGLTGPPGQTQKATKPLPAKAPPGQARKAVEPTTAPPPLPPGQLKPKNEPPPKKT